MAQTILIKRGLDTNLSKFTPLDGEILWTTDTHKLVIGDGSTAGGIELDYIRKGQRGIANGIASLDANIKIPQSELPAVAIVNINEVSSEGAQLALNVTQGDLCKRTDESITYVALNPTNGTLADWMPLNVPAKVNSVNGKQGDVVLTTTNIVEGDNLYYTDVRADARIVNSIVDTTASTTTLYSSSKIDSLISSTLVYKGAWDASTNTPVLADGTGTANDFYKVSVAGTQNLGGGDVDYHEGDDVIYNGTVWEKFGSVNLVESVNSKVGAVELDGRDIDLTGYTMATAASVITSADNVSEAIGKLEYKSGLVTNNVQADWDETNTSAESFINNKPTDLVNTFVDLTDTPTAIQAGDEGKALRIQNSKIVFDVLSLGDGSNISSDADDFATLDVDGNKNILAWKKNLITPSSGVWAPQNIDTIITVPFTQLSDTPSDYTSSGSKLVSVKGDESGIEFIDASSVGRTTLGALDDTDLLEISTGQALIYDGTNWANQTLPSGVTTLNELSDTDVNSAADGDCFKYNAATSKWENSAPVDITFSLGELDNVDTAVDTATAGQVLKFDGTEWKADTDSSTNTFLGLTDTEVAYPAANPENYSLKVNATGDGVTFVDTSVVDGGTF